MEGCKKMHCDSSTSKLMSKFLLICSIFNVMVLPICVCGVAIISKSTSVPINEILAPGFLGPTIVFILTGLLGFSASYSPSPTRPLIISTLVFSSLSIGLAFFSSIVYVIAYSMIYSFWEKDENNDDFEHAPSDSTVTCDDIKVEANVSLFIGITILVSMVNNIIVTVLWSKNICKCNCNSIDSSIPIATVRHPPANPQQFAPNWAVPLTGKQQQQFQSYSTAMVYSQQQPMN